MIKYDVYGLGNALVDTAIEVPEQILTDLKIDKGVMTLIDEKTAYELSLALHDYPHVHACGGSAANTMIAVAQFGGQGFYSCRVAADQDGDFYFKELVAAGLDTNLSAQQRQDGTTGKCYVLVTPDADRTMNSFLGATQDFCVSELVNDAIKASRYIYIEGYLVAQERARQAAILAKRIADENDVKTAITLSDPNMVQFFKEGLLEIIGNGVDLLFCNESEALLFTETTDIPSACQQLQQYAKKFVITLGPKGSLVYDGEHFHTVPGYQVKAIDTVGAGDMFAGAFLYGITHDYDYILAARMANLAAAKIVAKIGPRLTADEAESLLKEIKKGVSA